jgi:uncharacterized membrane protein YidH (DUF202 family)
MTRMTEREDADLVGKLRLISAESRPEARRWERRRRVTLSDMAVWVLFALGTAVVLLAMCLLLVIVWPAP